MRCTSLLAAAFALVSQATSVRAQAIIAQLSGLSNTDHVLDFGANLYPNFTPITTQFAGITVSHASYFTTGTSNNLVGGFLTKDLSGGADTLTIQFAMPISDLSFVYHQVGGGAPSEFRAMLGATTVDSFSYTANQSQPNNYFGFTNITFDKLQIDFVVDFNVDTLAFNDAIQVPQPYCTAGTTTNGCSASISASGSPSASASSGFTISVAAVEGQKQGILFYGVSGRIVSPWGTGTSLLCVKPPTQRMSVQTSGGMSGACNGALAQDWLAWLAANPSGLGAPFAAGDVVNAQAWFRDPPSPKTTNLSNALEFAVVP